MSSKNVNKKYLEKIEEFHKHNKLYYDENTPKISDEKFDILKNEILDLEKKHNYLNLILALLIPVGIHGLYNFSLSSSTISKEIAYLILLIFSVRAYILFKNLKKKQNQSKNLNKKYFTITLSNFTNAATTVLLIMLGLNYLISITL